MFVTHYPLLAEFEDKYPEVVRNYHMSFLLHDLQEGKIIHIISIKPLTLYSFDAPLEKSLLKTLWEKKKMLVMFFTL